MIFALNPRIPAPKIHPVAPLVLGFGSWMLGVVISIGCGPASATTPDSGIITVAVKSAPNNFDSRIGTDEISQRVHQLVYTNLMNLDDELRVVPGLADRLENPDPLTYVAHLRRGVRFHDGHELTSNDVVYTFDSFIDPDFISARKGAYRQMQAVEAIDRYTVRFRLKEPFGSFPVQLVMPVVPAGAGDSLRAMPVGTGPYRFVSYAVDDAVVVSSFPDYYAGAPANSGLVLKVIPDDTMRGLELRKGTIDLVVNDLSPDIVWQLRADGRLRVLKSVGTDYAYIGLNLRDPILRDRRVRHAIAYAIDRQAIVDYLRRGLAEPAIGVLAPVSWAFERNISMFNHDPDRARELLDEAGYRDPDGDGPLPRMTLSLKISTDEFIRLQAAVLQQNLRQVGIDLDVRSYEFATLYADVLKGNFQLFTLQWVGVSDPDMLRRVFHSRQTPPVGFNRGYYSNPQVDRVLDEATRSTDDAERKRLYGEAQKLIANDAPYISLWWKTNVAVTQRNITGLRLTPTTDFSVLKDVIKRTPASATP
jgi:peptide/nickel transport system substrate-binding protein